MVEVPLIIRIIAEIDLLQLCDLEPQGYKVRDSNYFMAKFGHVLFSYTYIVSYINYLAIRS